MMMYVPPYQVWYKRFRSSADIFWTKPDRWADRQRLYTRASKGVNKIRHTNGYKTDLAMSMMKLGKFINQNNHIQFLNATTDIGHMPQAKPPKSTATRFL